MVEDDIRPDAPPYYRDKATTLRTLADRTIFNDVRAELLALADRFDRMALWVEGRSPQVTAESGTDDGGPHLPVASG